MKLREFYEKSYGIKYFYIWYKGIQYIGSPNVPDELWNKTIEELEFNEINGKISCEIELVD